MANAILTPDIIAKEALRRLDNNLVFAKMVKRDYAEEFVDVGDTIRIKKPLRFSVTDGAALSIQDVEEGSTTLSIDKQRHVDIEFTSKSLTLDPVSFGEEYLEAQMAALAHDVDRELAALYSQVPSWAGTPGQVINSFADFAKGPERLDQLGVPQDMRYAVMSPADYWAMVGSQTVLNSADSIVTDAYRRARLGNVGGVETFMSQQIRSHTVGTHGGTPQVRGANQVVTYAASRTTGTQTLATDNWTANAPLKKGDVFTIAGVFAVNPTTKDPLPFLQQFTLVSDVTANATTTNETTLTIYPAMVLAGPYQNVSAAPADNAAITYVGTATTAYQQNLVFHKNAFALAVRPLVVDPSMGFAARATSKNGLSVRIARDYDIGNDKIQCRADILFGVKAIYPELATRLSGTA